MTHIGAQDSTSDETAKIVAPPIQEACARRRACVGEWSVRHILSANRAGERGPGSRHGWAGNIPLIAAIAILAKGRHAAIVLQFEQWCNAVRVGQIDEPRQADDILAPLLPVADEQALLTFDALWKRWEREAKPAPSTVSTWWGYVQQFQKHLGHDDPRRVTPDDVVAWKDALVARGLTSVRDGPLAAIKTLFNYGVANRLLKRNPAQSVTTARKSRAGKRRLPYDDDEVARLLSLADRATRVSRRWLPWLLGPKELMRWDRRLCFLKCSRVQ